MSFFTNIFNKGDSYIDNNNDFWNWFLDNEKRFFKVVKNRDDIENNFFEELSSKLNELKEGFFYQTGMYDDDLAELILTPDGNIKNIVFVEELIKVAPILPNWKFTALKRANNNLAKFSISMAGYDFHTKNLFFYANEQNDYPDEIEIIMVYEDYDKEDKKMITNACFIFLEELLGELNVATMIDSLKVVGKAAAEKELVPIEKLKAYLFWREKEFLEKYEGMRYDTENDSYSILEATLRNGKPLIALINTTLLKWDCKASHPWILEFQIIYDGENNNGMPIKEEYQKMINFEEEATKYLQDFDGYLDIGRETADNSREIYFACKEFRKASKIAYDLIVNHSNGLEIKYHIYKDKYWQTFEKFGIS